MKSATAIKALSALLPLGLAACQKTFAIDDDHRIIGANANCRQRSAS